MSSADLKVLYEAVDAGTATFEEFVWFVGDETDVQTILSWFKGSSVH